MAQPLDLIRDEATTITPDALKVLLRRGSELALLDVREDGEFAEGHLFLATSVPLSRFEPELLRLVPRAAATIVLYDDGRSKRAERAAAYAAALGYDRVSILSGGTAGWGQAGYELFEGVYVPSKTFGEIVEHSCHVPRISALELAEMQRRGDEVLVLDGRPFEEHSKMNIPGSVCLPNGDLALRIQLLVKDETTPIVVHCAGRTRSIIGAQTLRRLGLKNPIYALENGTQGWMLSGLELERGSDRLVRLAPRAGDLRSVEARAKELAKAWSVPYADPQEIARWQADAERTTYLLDVRSPEEYAAEHVAGVDNAPGGQLIQSTDLWLAVRGARVVLVDDAEIRAVVVASWLRQMGWESYVVAGGRTVWTELARIPSSGSRDLRRVQALPPEIHATELARMRRQGEPFTLLDLRSSMSYRKGHLADAIWATRSLLPSIAANVEKITPVVLIVDDEKTGSLFAADMLAAGYRSIRIIRTDPQAWTKAGLETIATPDQPPDRECIDFVFFAHGRYSGNLDVARKYLAWETGLLGRLDVDELALFTPRIDPKREMPV